MARIGLFWGMAILYMESISEYMNEGVSVESPEITP